jgi:hypothetical protein
MIRLSGVTEVVIKHWPTTMQDKMRRKNGNLNNLLLEHLFNLSRRGDTFLFSEVMVDYSTHWMLIQRCLHNAIGYSHCRHCRYQDAKEAYQDVTRLPMGSELNSVDLQVLTGGFGGFLSQQLEGETATSDSNCTSGNHQQAAPLRNAPHTAVSNSASTNATPVSTNATPSHINNCNVHLETINRQHPLGTCPTRQYPIQHQQMRLQYQRMRLPHQQLQCASGNHQQAAPFRSVPHTAVSNSASTNATPVSSNATPTSTTAMSD